MGWIRDGDEGASGVGPLPAAHRRDVPWTGRPLQSALWLLGVVAAVSTVFTVALVAQAHPDVVVPVAAYAVTGLANVAVGIVAWARRPSNQTGLLLCLTGFAIVLAAAGNVDSVLLVVVGSLLAEAPIGLLLHLVLAFPSGRLRSRLAMGLTAAGYGVTIGLQTLRLAFHADANLPGPWPNAHLEGLAGDAKSALGAVVLVAASGLLIARVVVARRSGRGSVALYAVYGYGVALLWFFPLSANVLGRVLGWSAVAVFVAQLTLLLVMPFVFAAGILRGGFARTGKIEELAAWLGADQGGRPPLREVLATALGDPSVGLFLPAGDNLWVDARAPVGQPSQPFGALGRGEGRALTVVDGPDGPLAAIAYDATLIAEPELVEAAGRLIALGLQREHLTAELLRSREQIRASRARLVEVADAERRRIAADLHDGLQARLVLAALHAGTMASALVRPVEAPAEVGSAPGGLSSGGLTAGTVSPGGLPAGGVPAGGGLPAGEAGRSADALRAELDSAISDLRGLVQGLMPAALLERGLFAAVEDLLDRVPLGTSLHVGGDAAERPLPPAVASTGYFVLAEAVTNAVKHAGARHLQVDLEREPDRLRLVVADDGSGRSTVGDAVPVPGHGLRTMRDRVEALDGTLRIDSRAGQGTTIRVELPCGS